MSSPVENEMTFVAYRSAELTFFFSLFGDAKTTNMITIRERKKGQIIQQLKFILYLLYKSLTKCPVHARPLLYEPKGGGNLDRVLSTRAGENLGSPHG